MRKVLSVFLTFMLILSMGTNVFAMNINDIVGTSGNVTYAEVDGLKGKTASDKVLKVTSTQNGKSNHAVNVNGLAAVAEDGTVTSKYFVMTFNYMPTGNNGLVIKTQNNQFLTNQVVTGDGVYVNYNKWNKVLVYVDYSHIDKAFCDTYYEKLKAGTATSLTDAEKRKVFPYTYFFINGVQHDGGNGRNFIDNLRYRFGMWNKLDSSGNLLTPSAANTDLRIIAENNLDVGSSFYIDDLQMYLTDTQPNGKTETAFATLAATENLSVNGANATVSSGTTIAKLKSISQYNDYTFMAYTDTDMTTVLGENIPLTNKHTLVITDAKNVVSYYAVSVDGITSITEGNIIDKGFSTLGSPKLQVEVAEGSMGKDASDKVVRITRTSDTDQNLQQDYLDEVNSDYFVIKFNYMPKVNANLILKTTKGVAFATVVSNNFVEQNKWNSVLVYVDYTELKSGSSTLVKSYLFVNGVARDDGFLSSDANNNYGKINTANGLVRTMRMFLAPAEDMDITTVSADIDDLYMYPTDVKPDGVAETVMIPITESSKLSVSGTVAKVGIGNSIADLSNAYPDYTFKAYESSDMTTEIDANVPLKEDNFLVIADEYGTMSYCTVEENDNSVVLYQTKDYSEFGTFIGADKFETNGIKGKVLTDTSLHAVSTATSSYLDYLWGTTAGSAWEKLNYKGYLVNEFSIINDGATKILLATHENTAVSAEIQGALKNGEWNRVVVVTDRTGGVNNGKTKTYVNGTAVSDWTTDTLGAADSTGGYYKNALRYYFEAPQGSGIYLDDVKIYEVEKEPVINSVMIWGDTFIAAGDNFNLLKETKMQNVLHNRYTIRGYTDFTFATELAQAATVVPGNVIVAENDKNGAISYFVAREWSGVSNILTETPQTVVDGSSALLTAPVFGKSGDDLSYKVIADSSILYYNTEWKSEDPLAKYLVYEVNVVPADETTSIIFGADGDVKMSDTINDTSGLVDDAWNKIVNVYNIETGYSDTYVNGVLVSESFKTDYKSAERNALTLIISKEAYVDDMKIYESAVYPNICKPFMLADGYNLNNRYVANDANKTIEISLDITAGEVASYFNGTEVAVFSNNTFATLINADEKISINNVIVIKTTDSTYSYYTVKEHNWNNIMVIGNIYDETTSTLKGKGTATFAVPVSNGGVLYVAQYDENGKLSKLALDDAPVNDCLSVDFAPDDLVNSNVKAFLMNSATEVVPLCDNLELNRKVSANILVIGNSFAVDLTNYLHSIAVADGVDYNVYVLDMGGKNITDHYNNREVSLDKSTINFWINTVHQGVSNLKITLEKYDFDYIVMQNWGDKKSFYTNDYTTYMQYWSKMVDLSEYIHEREPNAELMVHGTWSFEAGYGDFADKTVRDEIGADIDALNERCAIACAQAIGQTEPLRIISSMSAFNAAREYKNDEGVNIFDTIYYQDGHKFVGPNGVRVAVGDGTMLLSPEEQAAGKISLHRDGYHANPAGRYLIALNAYQTLSGRKVSSNAFRPGVTTLQSSSYNAATDADLNHATSGVVNQQYDPLKEEVVLTLQKIIDQMER